MILHGAGRAAKMAASLAMGQVALTLARRRGAPPGLLFAGYGRRLGLRLLARGVREGAAYLATPVNIVRYFEFPFALSCVGERAGALLDVSSPRLLALYLAERRRASSILAINPDARDIRETARIVGALRIPGIETREAPVEAIRPMRTAFDCVCSLSVIEHIGGVSGDTAAAGLMLDALRPGGRLVLTFPVDRTCWDEYRDEECYDLKAARSGAGYFFQRYYDLGAIEERILRPLDRRPSAMRWFGEKEPGRFAAYEKRWMARGHLVSAWDPLEIALHYREFGRWEEMPGKGVCGLMIEK